MLDALSNQMNNYSVKLAHSNALIKKRENYIEELEQKLGQLRNEKHALCCQK